LWQSGKVGKLLYFSGLRTLCHFATLPFSFFCIIFGPFGLINHFRHFLAFFEDLLIWILQKSEKFIFKVI